MKQRNPVIVITGSCANSGKSYLAKHLAINLGKNTTILSSDKIRIPLHSGNTPNHKLWNSLSKEKQKELGNVFDKIGGIIINKKTNKPYTKKQLDNLGGIWTLSSRLTAKYIIDYVKKNSKNETIIMYVDESLNEYEDLISCIRCDGSGYIPEYSHFQGGVCFECQGNRFNKSLFKIKKEH